MEQRDVAKETDRTQAFRPAHASGEAGSSSSTAVDRVTFVLDRDLRITDVVGPTRPAPAPVRHWMDLVVEPDHLVAYEALSKALVTHRASLCRLRFVHPWAGRVLSCVMLRSPLTHGGFLVHVDVPQTKAS